MNPRSLGAYSATITATLTLGSNHNNPPDNARFYRVHKNWRSAKQGYEVHSNCTLGLWANNSTKTKRGNKCRKGGACEICTNFVRAQIILRESKQIAKKVSPICFERARILHKLYRWNLGKRHEPRLARVFGQRGQYRKAKRHLFDVSCKGECPVKVCGTTAPSSNETACNNSEHCTIHR